MAAGQPFICTAEAGSPLDRLRAVSNAFIICPPNQPDQLADAVERLIQDPAERARLGRRPRPCRALCRQIRLRQRRSGAALRAGNAPFSSWLNPLNPHDPMESTPPTHDLDWIMRNCAIGHLSPEPVAHG
jgi:hypothetical protein